jgi:hypothetical protein
MLTGLNGLVPKPSYCFATPKRNSPEVFQGSV